MKFLKSFFHYFILILKWLLLGAFLLEGFYVFAVFVLLNTPLFHKVVSLDPRELKIDFSFGWSFLPGKVQLLNVTIDGQDPNVEWIIDLPHLKTHIELTDLIQKEVHFSKVTSDQVSFKLRLKGSEEKKIYKQGEEPDQSPEEKKKHWKLKFDDIFLASVGKLEVDKYFFTGDATIYGKFNLWPGVKAEVGPGFLDIKSGQVSTLLQAKAGSGSTSGSVQFIQNLSGLFEVKIDSFDIPKVQGSEVFDYLNIEAKMKGQLLGSKILSYYFRQIPNLEFGNEYGAFEGNFSIKTGVLREGKYELLPSQIEVSSRRFKVVGTGKLTGSINPTQNGSTSRLKMSLNQLKVFSNPSKTFLAKGDELVAYAESDDLNLQSLFTDVRVNLKLPEVHVPDISSWNSIFKIPPYGLHLESGKGILALDLYAESNPKKSLKNTSKNNSKDKLKRNLIHFDLSDVQGRMKGANFKGQLHGDLKFSQINLKSQRAKIEDGSVSLKSVDWKFKSPHGESTSRGWWFYTRLSTGSFDFGPHPAVSTRVIIQTKSSEPVLNFLRQEDEITGLKYKLLNIDLIHAYASLVLDREGVKIQDFDLKSETLGVAGHLSLLKNGIFGALKGKLGPLSVGIGFEGNETKLHLFPSDDFIKPEKK